MQKNMVLQERKYFPFRKTLPADKMKLRSSFPVTILRGDEDAGYPAVSLPLKHPAMGVKIFRELGFSLSA